MRGESLTYAARRSPRTATLPQVVKQLQQEWTSQLEPTAIWTACRSVAYRWRERLLDPVTTIPVFFVQMLHGNTACTHLRPRTQCTVTASAYCQARMKLPRTVFQQLLRSGSAAVPHEPLEEGRWCGPRPLWGEGSSCSMPDPPALPEPCGPSGTQWPGGGFPIAHLVALLQAGTGMVLPLVAAPLRPHDLSQGVALPPAWRPGDVLVADRGLCSSPPLALLVQAGVPAVCRLHQKPSVDFTPGRPHVEPRTGGRTGHTGPPRSGWRQQLGAHDPRVHWRKPLAGPPWMDAAQCGHLPDHLAVRALQDRVHRKGFRVQKIPLVTTLLEATRYPVDA